MVNHINNFRGNLSAVQTKKFVQTIINFAQSAKASATEQSVFSRSKRTVPTPTPSNQSTSTTSYITESKVFMYNKKGQNIGFERKFFDKNGRLESSIIEYTDNRDVKKIERYYDEFGTITDESKRYSDGSTSSFSLSEPKGNGKYGKKVKIGADGYVTTTTYKYDASGNQIGELRRNGKGELEEFSNYVNGKPTFVVVKDKNGNIIYESTGVLNSEGHYVSAQRKYPDGRVEDFKYENGEVVSMHAHGFADGHVEDFKYENDEAVSGHAHGYADGHVEDYRCENDEIVSKHRINANGSSVETGTSR